MARISGIDLPNKKIEYALRYLYGIGLTRAQAIVAKAQIDPETRANSLSPDQVSKIQKLIDDTYTVEGDLHREVISNIRHKQMINTYQGMRHKQGLPVRGQVTRHNARTRKGKKKTVGVVRKEVAAKMAPSSPAKKK